MTMAALSIFSGPGGVCTGLADTGRFETIVGVEWNEDAAATARAAGHKVVEADVRALDPLAVAREFGLLELILLLQLSPPCQGLSMAGKGKGREDVDALIEALTAVQALAPDADADELYAGIMYHRERLAETCSDDRSPLTFEVIRWIADLMPEYVMLEQVPAALPIWEKIAEVLIAWGYSVWTGYVHAEQFGVPQTRKRAMLLASLTGKVEAPVPTHSKFHSRSPERLDEGVLPWVSMAEALEWGMTHRPYPTIAPGSGTAGGGPDPMAVGGSGARKIINREHDEGRWIDRPAPEQGIVPGDLMFCATNQRPNAAVRPLDQSAPTLAFGHESPRWYTPEQIEAYRNRVREEVEPRVNNQSGTEFDLSWPADRPAPTIAGRDLVTMPGANANRFNGSTKSRNDGIRVEAWEAGVLQSFPRDYVWQGGKTSQFQQIGNAVPPLLQRELTLHLLGK